MISTTRLRYFASMGAFIAASVALGAFNHIVGAEYGLPIWVLFVANISCAMGLYRLIVRFPLHRRCPACRSDRVALRGYSGSRRGSYRCLNPDCRHDFETR